jgi:predicted O-methyltransferase YrrM
MPPAQLDDLLAQMEREGAIHDAGEPQHRLRRLNLERDAARLLQIVLLAGNRRRVLEIGTSNGYSALWIADALRRIPGASALISIERDADKSAEARANLSRAGLAAWADLRVGDATDVVAALQGPFDAVFFDADRISTPRQLELLLPKLTSDVVLMADNASSHPAEIAEYLAAIDRMPEFTSVLVPVGKGLHIAHRSGSGHAG